ncbi:hypothetical protein AB7C87_17025 [Natrarchaeobius sp. A-rgal3]|uniref:hypothetical protein n=1 Tax=Natrarchaeobius versutus TaxID=1679078 RepID=UPI00350F3FC7
MDKSLIKDVIKKYRSSSSVTVFVFVFAIVLGVVSVFAYFFTDAQLIEVIGVIATSTLYAILVIMYDQQKSIQEEQTEIQIQQANIQEDQKNLKSLEYSPHIRRKEWDEGEFDQIYMEIKNIGKGYASDLRLESRAKCISPTYNLNPYRAPLYRIKDEKVELQMADLEPGESGTFLTYVGIEMMSETTFSDTHSPFTCAVNKLSSTQISLIEWELDVIYTNPLGEENSETILSTTLDASEGISLTRAFHNPHKRMVASRFKMMAERQKRNSKLNRINSEVEDILEPDDDNPSVQVSGPPFPVTKDPLRFMVTLKCELGCADQVNIYVSGEKIATFDEGNAGEKVTYKASDEERITEFGTVVQSTAIIDGEEYKLDCQSVPDRPPERFYQHTDFEDISKSIKSKYK